MGTENTPEGGHEQPVDELKDAIAEITVALLGQSVVAWSAAQRSVEILTGVLLVSHGMSVAEARIVASNLDERAQCKIILALAYKAGLPKERLERTVEVVNSFQNELRNRRNRLYHDSWILRDGLVVKRETTGTKIHRPQSREISLLIPQYVPIEPKVLRDFISDCFAISDALIDEAEHIVTHLETRLRSKSGGQSPRRKTLWSRLLRRID